MIESISPTTLHVRMVAALAHQNGHSSVGVPWALWVAYATERLPDPASPRRDMPAHALSLLVPVYIVGDPARMVEVYPVIA